MTQIVVKDYHEAIRIYTESGNFAVIEATPTSATKRSILIALRGGSGSYLLVA